LPFSITVACIRKLYGLVFRQVALHRRTSTGGSWSANFRDRIRGAEIDDGIWRQKKFTTRDEAMQATVGAAICPRVTARGGCRVNVQLAVVVARRWPVK
jgi:hypothetical protein